MPCWWLLPTVLLLLNPMVARAAVITCNVSAVLALPIEYHSTSPFPGGDFTGMMTIALDGYMYREQTYMASLCELDTVSVYHVSDIYLNETIISCTSKHGNCTSNCPPSGYNDRIVVEFAPDCKSGNFSFLNGYPHITWSLYISEGIALSIGVLYFGVITTLMQLSS